MSEERGVRWDRSKPAHDLQYGDGWSDDATVRMWWSAVGKEMIAVTDAFEEVQKDGVQVTELRVKPKREGDGFLVICKGVYEGQKIVGFHAAPTVQEAMAELGTKLKKGAMKWRDDDLDRWLLERGLQANGKAAE